MILTDYFTSQYSATWDISKQSGVEYGTIRLPEDEKFDVTDFSQMKGVYDNFQKFGITPVVIEPLPNALHDHIKSGDNLRDESIEKCIKMLYNMDKLNIRTLCFNFMAYVGWCRTGDKVCARGGAFTTGFRLSDYVPTSDVITEKELWDNYTYFIKAVMPYAEKYNIKMALHPDDPPLARLGDVSRIMISYENIKKAVRDIVKSDNLGVTFCQATYAMMGEDLYKIIPELKDKIFFIHFRNAEGTKTDFHETFHDNGMLDMARLMRLYTECGIDTPIRVDHVPLLLGESQEIAGYSALGRLFAIGYLKGLMDANCIERK